MELNHVEWSGDSEKIITTTIFSVEARIYDIRTKKLTLITNLKNVHHPIRSSHNKLLLACLHYSEEEDIVSFIWQSNLGFKGCFPVETKNASSVKWAKEDNFIIVKEELYDTKVLIYFLDGIIFRKFDKRSFKEKINRTFIDSKLEHMLFLGFSNRVFKKGLHQSKEGRGVFLSDIFDANKEVPVYEEFNNKKLFPEKNRECGLNS